MRNFRASLIIAALFSGSAAYADTPGWTISESSGPVFVAKSGVTKAGLRGGALAAGDTVVTGAKGRAVLVRGTEYLIVAANTKLQIAPPTANSFTQIVQQVGNVVFKIKKQMTPHFAVETPYLAAVVKGTTFSVTVTPAGTSVQVTEGLVEVATPDRSVAHFVQPGEIGMISSANPRLLTVQGKETIRLEAPVLPGAPVAAKGETSPSQPAAAAASDGIVIASAVSEGPVSLSDLSGGLVDGNSALVTASRSTDRIAAVVQASTTNEVPQPVSASPAEVAIAVPAEPAPAPAEVAVALPAEPVAEAVEVAVALPVESAPEAVEVAVALPPEPAPVEVAVALPPEPAPVEVAVALPPEPAPVEVAVALPPEPAPVEVAVALPPEPAPVEVAVALPPEPAPVEVAVALPSEVAPAPVEVAAVLPDVIADLPAPAAPSEPVIVAGNGNSNNSGSGNSSANGNSNNSGNGNGSRDGGTGDIADGSDFADDDRSDSFFVRLIDFLKAKALESGFSANLPGSGN